MNRPALWRLPFILVSAASFFLFLAFYTLSTTLPLYVERALDGSQGQMGLSMMAFILAAVVCRPLAGRWVDKLGSRPILLAGIGLFFAASLLYFAISGYRALLALRVVHGIGFGLAATAASAAAAQLVPAERKGEGIGYFSLFISLAMVVGPFIGLTVTADSAAGFGALFGLCAAFAAAALLASLPAKLPQPAAVAAAGEASGSALAAPSFLRSMFERRALPIALAGFILAFAYSGITTFISVYAGELDLAKFASWFFVAFALMIVLPRPITGRLYDRYGAHVLVYPGIALFAVGIAALGYAGSSFAFLASGAVIGLGYGLLFPSFQTLAIQSSPPHRAGIATSTYFVLFDSGYGIGSYALGMLAAGSSYSSMYLASAVIAAFSAISYYVLHHRKQKSAAASWDVNNVPVHR
jgi:MFS family permease